MMRKLVATTKSGSIFFDLIDEAGKKLATVLATPYDAKIVISNTNKNLCLTPAERFFCQMEAKKSLN